MRVSGRIVVAVWVLIGLVSPSQASEPYSEFLEGLRERRYYDYALFYLDTLQQRDDLPADFRTLIPFEKAVTLIDGVELATSVEAQTRQLDQAAAFLEQFVQQNPRHEKVALANSKRALIVLNKARVEIVQSRSPANEQNRASFQRRARQLIQQARQVFQKAHDQHKAAWEGFPRYIDPDRDSEQYAAREVAELGYMQAQLDLGLCAYEDAQTYDKESNQFQNKLIEASRLFEEIHSKYRTQGVGLFARMWQGKCFEEQGDIRRSLGIYNELLGHKGQSPTLKRLQDNVREFRLICLNHDERKDYHLTVQEADDWLNENRGSTRTQVGFGIRWQQALAYEKLADDPKAASDDKERLLRQALANAREINRFDSPYKDIAMFKIRELTVKLRGKEAGDPNDFDTAFGLGSSMVSEIGPMQDRITSAPANQKTTLHNDLDLHLEETARYLKLALELADSQTDEQDLNHARVKLSFVYYLMGRSYDSAILGEFVASRYTQEYATLALDGAYFAMAAYLQSYNASTTTSEQSSDLNHVAKMCELIDSNWPESDRANDARINMGKIYAQNDRLVEAAEWFSRVPDSSPDFAASRIEAGRAFWNAYVQSSNLPDEDKPTAEQLQQWRTDAERLYREGLKRIQQGLSSVGEAPPEVLTTKAALAQIALDKGDYPGAIRLLKDSPQSVMDAVDAVDESNRPADGIQGPKFASLAYQLLLRAYVGTQKLDDAREAMQRLEEIGGGANGESVTRIYRQLGTELEKELDRLKNSGNSMRLAQVRESFESFLNSMFERKDQTFGSLFWMAETYSGLGEGSLGEPAQADAYFGRAAQAYQQILSRASSESGFLEPTAVPAVTLRLAACRRRMGEYQDALEIVSRVLKEQPQTLTAQREAAFILQDWAADPQKGDPAKYLEAIRGVPEESGDTPIWGWASMGLKLQRLINIQQSESETDYRDHYYEARYNTAFCRQQYAQSQSDEATRKEQFQRGLAEIQAFAVTTQDVDSQWWGKFDTLYRELQGDLGIASPVALQRASSVSVSQDTPNATVAETQSGTVADSSTTAAAPSESAGSGWGMIVVAVIMFVGCGVGIYMMFANQGKNRRSYYTAQQSAAKFEAPTFDIAGDSPVKTKRAATKERRTVTGSDATVRVKRAKPGQPTGKRKPRPKPPTAE